MAAAVNAPALSRVHNAVTVKDLHTCSGRDQEQGREVLPQVGLVLWWSALRHHLHGSSVDALKEQWRLQHFNSALQ